MTVESEVDFSDFEAQVDQMVEAAANRDAEIEDINDRFSGYSAKLAKREQELREELAQLAHRRQVADRHRLHLIGQAKAAFTEANGHALSDEPPF